MPGTRAKLCRLTTLRKVTMGSGGKPCSWNGNESKAKPTERGTTGRYECSLTWGLSPGWPHKKERAVSKKEIV